MGRHAERADGVRNAVVTGLTPVRSTGRNMRRQELKARSVTQSNNASSIGNHRNMAHRAKQQSAKTARQILKKDLEDNVQSYQEETGLSCVRDVHAVGD